MKTARFNVVFNRNNTLNENKEAAIYIIVYHNKKRKYFSTGIFIEVRFWDEKNGIVKTICPDAYKYNKIIADRINKFKEIELNCILKGIEFNLEMLDSKEIPEQQSFTKFFKAEIEKREIIAESTRTKSMTAFNSFESFAGDVSFSALTYTFIENYDNFLRKKYDSEHTIRTRHKVLKTYLNIAIKKGFMELKDYPYRDFRLKEAKSNRGDLSFTEIEKLEKLELVGASLNHTRDLFLFSCYTGLRFEDVKQLTHNNIFTQKGEVELRTIVNKTNDEIRLPLSYLFNAKAIAILDRYRDLHPPLCLPQYSNEFVNRNLKILAHLIGFKGVLFFHIARHTFGSRLAEIKPDPYLIKDLMGHKDIKTSMDYINTSGKIVQNKLKEIKW